MSRREDRESDSKRHRSRFEREPSPKRSRRDGKPATERPSGNASLNGREYSDRKQKHHQRLQDALPLEDPPLADSKLGASAGSKKSDKKADRQHEGTKRSSDHSEVLQSKSYSQHNERGNTGQAGQTSGDRAATDHGGWKDSKGKHDAKATERSSTYDSKLENEKSRRRSDDNHAWRHDGVDKTEVDQQPPPKKRTFTERKIPQDSENADKEGVTEPEKPSRADRPSSGNGGRDERERRNPRYSDRPEKPLGGHREPNEAEEKRGSILSRGRFAGGSSYWGRDRLNGRQGYRPGGERDEKWKHDLFEEANRSPSPKKDEDLTAKVEALLAS